MHKKECFKNRPLCKNGNAHNQETTQNDDLVDCPCCLAIIQYAKDHNLTESQAAIEYINKTEILP